MNLKEIRERYRDRSQQTSDIVRKLGLAGVAIIWLFKVGEGESQRIPMELLWPAIGIVVSLSLDLLQYASGAAIWAIVGRTKEKYLIKNNLDQEKEQFDFSPKINWPGIVFFWGKFIFIFVAYALLFNFLFFRLFHPPQQ